MRLCLNRMSTATCVLVIVAAANMQTGCRAPAREVGRWNENYAYVNSMPPITFHYRHGILAGSYPGDAETMELRFDDVCAQLGHVCLCGAGGFRIAGKTVEALRREGPPLERGEFVLISSRDHTVGDVIASVLGCSRRAAQEWNQYWIDDSISAPRREYFYYIAHPPAKVAVRVAYRKHLLIGHEEMDQLWEIESEFDRAPAAVTPEQVERYRKAMTTMVRDVLFDRIAGLITVEPMEYADFEARLESVRR